MIQKHLKVYAATSKMTKKVFALENDRFVLENLNFFDNATFLEGSSLLCGARKWNEIIYLEVVLEVECQPLNKSQWDLSSNFPKLPPWTIHSDEG